jgi:Co/Zn/Cd efflux system component
VIPSKIKSFIHTWSLTKNTNVCITSNTIEYDQSKQNKKLSKIIREITHTYYLLNCPGLSMGYRAA